MSRIAKKIDEITRKIVALDVTDWDPEDLIAHIESTEPFWRSFQKWKKNYYRKMDKGTYNHSTGVKGLLLYLVNSAAKDAARELDVDPRQWDVLFPKSFTTKTAELLAERIEEDYKEEHKRYTRHGDAKL